ncbi:MAG: prolyl oligopeptidase family serine peptidase [Acidobacteriota bacterium]
MTRRTWLMLAGALAGTRWGNGQYVLPAQAPPAERFPPTPEQAAEIARKMAQLQDSLASLKQKGALDESLAEVEIFHKAAEWIGRYHEYFTKNSVDQTLALLDTGIARAGELEAGKPSWPTATGPVIRAYRSRVDGSVQPYIAYVPASYDRSRPVRMDIFLHGTNRGMVEVQFMSHTSIGYGGMKVAPADYIQIELLGRTNNAYRWAGEADVLEAVEAAKKNYAIDENRVLLRGFSMGGSGTWHLGLHHPDHWAAIEPGAGFNDTIRYGHFSNLPPYELKGLHIYDAKDYSLNIFQLPTAAYTGEIDGQIQNLENLRQELEKNGFSFQPDGLNFTTKSLPLTILVGPNTPHRWEAESKKRADVFMNAAAKKGRTDPDHIRFVTYTTRYNRCFWVTVEGLDQHYQRAEVDARRSPSDGTIEVKTANVSALALKNSGVKKISIDGHNFNSTGEGEMQFLKRAGAWKEGVDNSVRKRHGLQGPIDDAFLGSFLCVSPTGQAAHDLAGRYAQETLGAFVEDFAKFFRGEVRVKDDTAVTASDIADHHLIVFGDPQSNQVLGRALSNLPLRWDARELSLGGKTYDSAKHTVAMVYPNPLNPRRYMVVNSGHSFHRAEMAATNSSLFPRFGDFAVLELRQPVGTPVESEIMTADYFDEEWKLPHA